MFEAVLGVLKGAVRRLDIPVDGDALAEVIGVLGELEAAVTRAVGEFDAAKLWELDAEASMTGWLRERARMSTRSAARMVRCGRRVSELPAVAAAWREGRLSSGQVEAITAQVKQRHVEAFAEVERALVDLVEGLSVAETVTLMRTVKTRLDHDDEAGPPAEAELGRSVHLSSTLDDRWRLDGDLDPESGQIVHTAIRLAQANDVAGEPRRSPAARRADALVDVCQYFLDHQKNHAGGRHRPHVNVIVDIQALRSGSGGVFVEPDGPIGGAGVSALLCDSALHRVVMAGRSAILDYGTATRTIPAALWNALVVRDRHCRFPGCDRPSWWCDGHHVVHVEHGGPTCPENVVLACRRHHRILHRPGWQAELLPGGTVVVTDPNGHTRTSRPPGTLS